MKRIMLLCALCITGITGWFYFTLDVGLVDKTLDKNLGGTDLFSMLNQEYESTANKKLADDTLAGDTGSLRVFRKNESHPYHLSNDLLK